MSKFLLGMAVAGVLFSGLTYLWHAPVGKYAWLDKARTWLGIGK